jgi:hypothetical protein
VAIDRTLSYSTATHGIQVPLESVDIADSLFHLPLVSLSDCITPAGRTKVQIIRALSWGPGERGDCRRPCCLLIPGNTISPCAVSGE